MEDRTNTLQSDYGISSFPYKETEEDKEARIGEAEWTLRHYYDDISFAKGKEEIMARSVEEARGYGREEEGREFIKNGWLWYNASKDVWEYSDKKHKEKLGW